METITFTIPKDTEVLAAMARYLKREALAAAEMAEEPTIEPPTVTRVVPPMPSAPPQEETPAPRRNRPQKL